MRPSYWHFPAWNYFILFSSNSVHICFHLVKLQLRASCKIVDGLSPLTTCAKSSSHRTLLKWTVSHLCFTSIYNSYCYKGLHLSCWQNRRFPLISETSPDSYYSITFFKYSIEKRSKSTKSNQIWTSANITSI